MRTERWLSLLAGVALAMSLVPATARAQDDWFDDCEDGGWRHGRRDRVRFCEIREQRLPAGQAINVNTEPNGGVMVRAWSEAGILVRSRVEARGDTRDEARALAGDIKVETSGGTIRAQGPDRGSRHSWSVSFLIYVPKSTDITATTENGPIEVEGVVGKMSLRAENGPVELTSVGGDITARTTNGPLHVELGGKTWEGVGLDAETINGPVELEVPSDYSAKLETGTVHGPIDVDFPLTVTLGSGRMRRFSATLGAGGPTVRVVTTNGPLTVRR